MSAIELPPRTPDAHIVPWRYTLSSRIVVTGNTAMDWMLRHWLGIINWSLGIIILGALIIPMLAYLGIEPLAGTLFRMYHTICEQIPSHSFFLFGHQIARAISPSLVRSG
jgi:hypothetical protein